MNLKIILAFLGFFPFCCYAVTIKTINQPISIYKTLGPQLQAIIDAKRAKFKIPSLSFAVLLPMSAPLSLTSGPVSSNKLFQVGSLTKTFTATLVAQAIAAKRLALTDTVGKFLPEYPKWRDITLGQLVNQTSGIFDYDQSENWWDILLRDKNNKNKTWTEQKLLAIAYQHPLHFPAGSSWEYSNSNYVLLGLILEKINHKPLQVLMADLIKANHLNETFFLPHPYPVAILNKMAQGYSEGYDVTDINGSWLQAAGALVSTPQNLVIWLKNIFNPDNYGNKKSVSFTQYITLKNTDTGQDVRTLNDTGYSFGLFRSNTPEGIIWWTPGLTPGYTTRMVYAPCLQAYFAYSTNTAPVGSLHVTTILQVLHLLNHDPVYQDFLKKQGLVPPYCANLKPGSKFVLPKLG